MLAHRPAPETVYVSVNPGAGLARIFDIALQRLLNFPYDTVCINGGICDITQRDPAL